MILASSIMATALQFEIEDVELVVGDGSEVGGIVIYGFSDSAKFMGAMDGDPELEALGQHNGQIKDHYDLVSDWWVKFNLIDEKPAFEDGVSMKPMQVLVDSGYEGE